jgi:hypothetical protein
MGAVTDIDDRTAHDPFAPHPPVSDGFPAARWERAGATADEVAAMGAAYDLLSAPLQKAETDKVGSVADGVLASRLEEIRSTGSVGGGLTFVTAVKVKKGKTAKADPPPPADEGTDETGADEGTDEDLAELTAAAEAEVAAEKAKAEEAAPPA